MDSEAISTPEQQQQPPNLKRQRGVAKAAVTRLMTQITSAMNCNQPKEVETKLSNLDEAVAQFHEVHDMYHKTLEDDDDLDASNGYLTSVMRDVQDLQHTVLSWLEDFKLESPDAINIQDSVTDEIVKSPISFADQLSNQLQELHKLRQKEKQEFSMLMAQQEERLRAEFKLQLQHTELKMDEHGVKEPELTTVNKDFSTPVSGNPPLNFRSSFSTVNENSLSQLLELSKQQYQSHIDSMHLPPVDIIKFDGEPLKYWQFMKLFNSVIDKETVPDQEKLTRLYQYTVGQARDAISHCLYNPDSSLGYANAMAILKKRFGNPYAISQAWVDKVLNYKDIKDNKQLQSFADILCSCRDTLKAMKCEEELNGGRTLLQIVEKLPEDLKKRWLTINYEIINAGRMPKLDDIVSLVESEAAKRADPIYGKLLSPSNRSCLPNSKSNAKSTFNKKRQTFAVTATNEPTTSFTPKTAIRFKCPKCTDGHFLNQCQAFRALSVQERLIFVQQQKLCLNCFMKGHQSSVCTRSWVCKVPGCGKKHNSWLHSALVTSNNTDYRQSTNQESRDDAVGDSPQTIQAHATRKCTEFSKKKIALPILPVVVSDMHNQFSMNVFALLDSGSNGTFASKKLVHALKLESRKVNIKLNTMETKNLNVVTMAVDLCVEDAQRRNSFQMKGVICRDHLNISLDNLVTQQEVFQWPHLQEIADEISLPDIDLSDEVHLLIGLDQPDILVPRETRCGESGEPYAVLTGLGWTLHGPISNGSTTISANFIQADNSLQQAVERFWKLDDPVHVNNNSMSIVDKQVVELWKKQAVKENGHYTLPIPFKEHPPRLPCNYAMAKHRLDLLGRRLKKDPDLQQKYIDGICDSLRKGYAEEVVDINRDDGWVWYLPHHPVLHPRKPGKIRIVFDCAARYQGASLNDCIHQGPDLTNKLLAVLLKFRQDPIALNADIESMYYQVKVPPQERDVLRFLWWEDNDPDKPPKHFRMTAHLFGGVWSPSAANFAMQKVTEDNCERFSDDALETVRRNFYVDDCLKSLSTVNDAIKLASELRELLSCGGFRLTKWLSNSKEVMKTIPAELWANSLHEVNLDQEDLPYERTLGVLWDVERDCFTFEVKTVDKPATKRGILSTTSSIFDPLGFASPFVLKAKAIFQELCRRKVDWDEEIPADVVTQWRRWLNDLPLLSALTIPRCLRSISTSCLSPIQLHHFSDASELAYGAVSYIMMDETCRLVMSKARLAPIKPISIPRLELLAAVVATELDQIIKHHLEIPIGETFFWTDSTIVLQYINNKHCRFQTFVANRVAKILERSEPSQWRHIDSASNPADDVSRGMTVGDILSSKRWVSGPQFLLHEKEHWPIQPDVNKLPEEAEIKRTKDVYAASISSNQVTKNAMDRLLEQYSSWHRLKRATAILLRLKTLLRKKANEHLSDPITVDELQEAELAILSYIQTKSFGTTQTKNNSLAKLKPYQDDNDQLLRVGGRLTNAPIPFEAKHPIILPNNHHVTSLIVNHYHLRLGHAGTERVLSEIRQRFWILKGRVVINQSLKSCLQCRKLRAKPQDQQMADLPDSRVTPSEPPFSRVGIDYFGPFLIKRARSEIKRYGCLFTCLTTRAIHLEIAHSLDTDSFINALQRFIARRGPPTEIRSDNGTNFVGGLRELRNAIRDWNQLKISDYLLQNSVKWIFNPPAASHMGGIWERQIRTVRSVLNTVLSQQTPDDEGLATLFCCVESIVNGRPITKLSDDPSDPLPLTPNHLLLLRSGPTLPPGAFVKQDLYRRRWRQVQYLADVFWARWIKEYLPALQQRQKWHQPKRNLKVGDLVLILHEHTPRNHWPLGLLTQVYPGADGLVRTVEVKTQAGIFTCPVDKICLLEANFFTNDS
ncbi:uncharacterized protein LOC130219206 [Danio aesculapii]|uniref:uncharacterized protein LOC130219206 n=1 Tax=Danio aesculapii TaxID=1142201 RepID=UPI0024BFDE61|nr:uncharacterized protein LOC130219206 [Danio aesculapii]